MKKLATALLAASMLVPVAAQAQEFSNAGSWMVRARAIAVVPDESSVVSIGGEADANTAIMPEVDITYFFTDNFAMELIAATTNHDVAANGTVLGDLDLGDVWVLPPTLTAQYHFPVADGVSVYGGAGLNLTLFYGDDLPDALGTDIDYDSSFGPAVQAGMDIHIKDNMYFNIDVKKIWINTDVTIDSIAGVVTADVDLDPWVFGAGVGWRF